jgi:hypothetical protein
MTMTTRYKLSKDYAVLVEEIMAGKEIACFLEYYFYNSDKKHKDVARAQYSKLSETYSIGVRGASYLEEYTSNDFMFECEKANVEFFQECDA